MAGSSANPSAKPLSQRAPLRVQKFDISKRKENPQKYQDHREQLESALKPKGKSVDASETSKRKAKEPSPDESSEDEIDEEMMATMREVMGFTRFRSTHNMKVPGNNVGYVRKTKVLQYRQYMNRSGGFNRALSPSGGKD
ncbi:hypothetical protein N7495_007701 [Penicillium taxi]|uniref:uncharacterized protein n=1 Tax=Penicillium taxi TaxID=168475 RepID=UPI0025457E46|nr:uncharacterized protein N7495_007701 [Penicillium taxi]KAJ5887660.1 hypothetical protein N7495_007701 [Penicillium taxi]